MNSIIHFIICFAFIGLFLAFCFVNGSKRFTFLAISCVLFLFFTVDYSLADYRGIGLSLSDFASGSNAFSILREQGIYIGNKHMLCLMWLISSGVVGTFATKIKNENLKNAIIWIMVIAALGLGAITEYPVRGELFFR